MTTRSITAYRHIAKITEYKTDTYLKLPQNQYVKFFCAMCQHNKIFTNTRISQHLMVPGLCPPSSIACDATRVSQHLMVLGLCPPSSIGCDATEAVT